ncbi:hypothetical protein, partial [Salmonella sp. SAL4458]|uniref:hypothetical protein n=1 Tax=Salmonella sp. SAL4458 TaxID=3159913 RepID=UPI00397B1747
METTELPPEPYTSLPSPQRGSAPISARQPASPARTKTGPIEPKNQNSARRILRFGKYYETVGPGLNFYFPPIDTRFQENVTRERAYSKQGQ